MIKEILTPEVATLIITAVILPFARNAIKLGFDALSHKVNKDKYGKYLCIAQDAIETSVSYVAQTYVDTLKKNGTWNQEAAIEAFNMAKSKAVSIMGEAAKEGLREAYADFDAWIDSRLEKAVREIK